MGCDNAIPTRRNFHNIKFSIFEEKYAILTRFLQKSFQISFCRFRYHRSLAIVDNYGEDAADTDQIRLKIFGYLVPKSIENYAF